MHRLDREELEGQHLEGPLKDLGAVVGSHAPLDGQKKEMVSWSLFAGFDSPRELRGAIVYSNVAAGTAQVTKNAASAA